MSYLPSFFLIVALILTISSPAFSQDCPTTEIINRQVRASQTDPKIPFELVRHQVWINPACEQNGKLLVHLVGTIDIPSSTTFFPALAANRGYRVVSLKYPNDLSAQSACRNSEDTDCYENFRREIVEGVDTSSDLEVNRANSIENRLQKLLQYLIAEYPEESWSDFLVDDEVNWRKLVVSGHSQGGGHAAFIAKDRVVERVIMFASPNDYDAVNGTAAAWTAAPHLTPDSAYYAFGNRFDDIVDFREEYLQWTALGIGMFGDTVNVQEELSPYLQSNMLYTREQKPGLAVNHSLMITDDQLTLDMNGIPVYEPVWIYLLGLEDVVNKSGDFSESRPLVQLVPNPSRDATIIELPPNLGDAVEIRLLDLNGVLLHHSPTMGATTVSLDLRQRTAGIYLVQVWQSGKQLVTKRLVVLP